MAEERNLQQPFDVTVAIPTILRQTLLQCVRSIFAQDHPGRVQILIGIDHGRDEHGLIDTLRAECPARMAITVIDPGYSTSRRHGGVYPTKSGGSLRTAMSYLANSRYVAYLDDDNWWGPSHLSSLLRAIQGKAWAYSLRTLVDAKTDEIICRDEWESIGPGRGVYDKGFGGFVDSSCLMVDKLACHEVLPAWAISRFDQGSGDDRMVFERLKSMPCGASGEYTAFYRLRIDGIHPYLMWNYKKAGVDLSRFVSPDRMPPDSVWEECAQHDRAAAGVAASAPEQTAAAAVQNTTTAFVGAKFSITYAKR